MNTLSVAQGVASLKQGKIIAYPTEAVFGLGCCPHNTAALQSLVALKGRSSAKGFILIASHIEQLLPYINMAHIPGARINEIIASWPGPCTWVFPVASKVSPLLIGEFKSIAVRVTNHPVARALCEEYQAAIVSTSANLAQQIPLQTAAQVNEIFGEKIAGVVAGELGKNLQPTTIQDALTGKMYRS